MASTRRSAAQAAGLLLTGAVAGGVLAVTLGASASSPSAGTTGPTSYAATGPARGGGPDGRMHGRMHGFGVMQAGTVTAVGAKSVAIKGTGAAKTYAVDANSDIDKNGEATLSDLRAGDAVRFVLRPGTSTIAVLHAGDEAKDRPPRGAGGPGGPCPGGHPGDGDGPGGTQPRPAPTSAAPTSGA